MKRFVEGVDREQITLFPAVLDDYVGEDNPVRAIDVFVDGLDLAKLGFDGVAPLATGRPAYHPAPLLKIYIYGYFNRVQSSRRLERECQRNVELVWLTGHLMPDFKTSRISARTTARRFAKSAARSFCYAGVLTSLVTRAWRSTAASSRQ
jgi:transposase